MIYRAGILTKPAETYLFVKKKPKKTGLFFRRSLSRAIHHVCKRLSSGQRGSYNIALKLFIIPKYSHFFRETRQMQHVDFRLLKNIQNTLIIIRSTSSAFNIKPARDGDKFKKKKIIFIQVISIHFVLYVNICYIQTSCFMICHV